MLHAIKTFRRGHEAVENAMDTLKNVYRLKLFPLEERYLFHEFHSPQLTDADFQAKPMVLLLGQYSTGKSTFIKYLLERGYPGIRIGPEPTTDRFIAVMHDEKESVVPGNALVVDPNKQFRELSRFGASFLNRFQCSTTNSPVLKTISLIDTPGILSGEKQRIERGYDFPGVLEWFAERVDRIILLFDAHKLDISDEYKRSIVALKGHDDKVRILLNKADKVNHQELMRVYGALMWSLGKIFATPEVARVYIGSFWDQPLHFDSNRKLFEDEEQDLFRDLQALPGNAALRKINDFIKRARLAKVHALIISELHKNMPRMLGKEAKQIELINNLGDIYEHLEKKFSIPPGDFPNIGKMQNTLQSLNFANLPSFRPQLIHAVDHMLSEDLSQLLNSTQFNEDCIEGGAFESVINDTESPFGYLKGEGSDAGAGELEWICAKSKPRTDAIFNELQPVNGRITGSTAKQEFIKSKLPSSVLGKIWKLSDVDKDGFLDSDEFALAQHLINIKLEGCELPTALPTHLVPPSKRG